MRSLIIPMNFILINSPHKGEAGRQGGGCNEFFHGRSLSLDEFWESWGGLDSEKVFVGIGAVAHGSSGEESKNNAS